jgi:hypothetical protein
VKGAASGTVNLHRTRGYVWLDATHFTARELRGQTGVRQGRVCGRVEGCREKGGTHTRKGSLASEVSVILKDTLPPAAAAAAGAAAGAASEDLEGGPRGDTFSNGVHSKEAAEERETHMFWVWVW